MICTGSKILRHLKWDATCVRVGFSPGLYVPQFSKIGNKTSKIRILPHVAQRRLFSSSQGPKTTSTTRKIPHWFQYPNSDYEEDLDDTNIEPSKYTTRSHTCGELTAVEEGQRVTLYGWLAFKRLRGMFFVLRDTYGLTQAILPQTNLDAMNEINRAPLDSVVRIVGTVALRPEKQQKQDIVTGQIEIHVDEISVISKPDKARLSNREYGKVEEELGMEYRYLALRSEMLQKRLKFRAQLLKRMRRFMNANHFIDIETPTLLRRTPGGAREFPVATHHKGLFYSLAQSPQILKQLLMVGGMDRYYQIARCYRDEKSTPDRQPEFTQLDIELSFTTREQVMMLIEDLLRYSLQIPVQEKFEILSYDAAMSKYGSDKPDTGGFVWIVNFPLFCQTENYTLEASHHPFTMPTPESDVYNHPSQAIGLSYDLVYRGNEIGGGSIRINDAKLQRHIYENVLRLPVEDIEYLLNALDSGCPPHGGFAIDGGEVDFQPSHMVRRNGEVESPIAFILCQCKGPGIKVNLRSPKKGLDRLVALLTEARSIRDVIAFPKTSEGKDLMSKAPSSLTNIDKDYYHLQ